MKMDSSRMLVVTSTKSLPVLELWLKDRVFNDLFPWLQDKSGSRMVGLNKLLPDGKFERAGLVIVRDPLLLDQVIEICRAAKRDE